MANIKQFTIKINGIQESVDAIEALSNKLNALDLQINKDRKIEVEVTMPQTPSQQTNGTTTSSSGGRNNSGLSEEAKLQNQIIQNAEKITAARTNDYQVLLRQKETLKDINVQQKANVAETALQTKEYANTMQGLKQELADIKQVMQTTDLADDKFKDLVGRAGQLTQKLKDIEAEYGTFGRNVGNYASAAEGFKNFSIEVAGATQEFNSAKQALMELKKEMQTLSAKKDMGLISDEEAERLKSLIPVVKELESSIKDAGKPMDALMDTMQSVVAIAQAGKGLSALFGFDNNKIEESIQKLVALQNVMQSIQTMQKQMQTGEGLFGMFSKANAALDAFIVKANAGTASMRALGKAANVASIAIKGIGKALGWISIALVAFDLIKSIFSSKNTDEMERQKKTLEAIDNIVSSGAKAYAQANANLKLWIRTIDNFNGSAKQEKKLLEDLDKETNGLTKGCKSLSEAKQKLIDGSAEYLEMLKNEAEATAILQLYTEEYAKNLRFEQVMREATKNLGKVINDAMQNAYDNSSKKLDELTDLYASKMSKVNKAKSKLFGNDTSGSTKTKNDVVDYEKELTNLRIQNMKEGLNKVLAQLEEERKQKIAKVRQDGKMVKELEFEINKQYDKKIEDARKEHAKKMQEISNEMWSKINDAALTALRNQTQLVRTIGENEEKAYEKSQSKIFNQNISSYGVQGKRQLSKDSASALGIVSNENSDFERKMEKYIDSLRKASIAENEYQATLIKVKTIQSDLESANNKLLKAKESGSTVSEKEIEAIEKEIEALKEKENAYKEELNAYESNYEVKLEKAQAFYDYLVGFYGKEEVLQRQEELMSESYSRHLTDIFEQRRTALNKYWVGLIADTKKNAEIYYNARKDELDYAKERELEDNEKWAKELNDKLQDAYDKKLIILENYEKLKKSVEDAFKAKNLITENKYKTDLVAIENEKNEKIIKANSEALQIRLQDYRDFLTALNDLEQKQPVKNAWGIINLKETNKINKELLNGFHKLAIDVVIEKKNLQKMLDEEQITFDDFQNANRELDRFVADLGEKMDKVKHELSFGGQWEKLAEGINNYVQKIGQSLQTIMQAFNEHQDYQFEKEQDALDKQLDLIQKKYDEQEKLAQDHKNAMDDIEDELTSARGDRRQQLIDALNAEMAAQRAALAEQKKAEKEKERLEEEQDKLDKRRKKAEYERNLQSILVSGAMAVSNGLATQPFVPVGIAMGSLAASLAAVQYALARKQKPYGDGGVIEGKAHKDGGVPVLGGRVSVEGGEFITNKVTTSKNVELLEYINSKKKKVDISDMLEFYSSGKPSKAIAAVSPKSKFADGGQIPSLRNDIDISDRMYKAMEDYANRPSYVQVVDIIDRTERLNEVKVISGLEV